MLLSSQRITTNKKENVIIWQNDYITKKQQIVTKTLSSYFLVIVRSPVMKDPLYWDFIYCSRPTHFMIFVMWIVVIFSEMLLHHFYFQVNLCSRVETRKHGIVKGTVSTEIECYFGTCYIKYLFHQEPLMVKNKVFVRDSWEKFALKLLLWNTY
jgi:hypothetical protein